MPLTLASNAITFTDNTALSSGIITAAQLSAGAVTTSRIATNAVTFDKISQNSGPFNFRNKIINGNFDIWQRGTIFTVNSVGADRWVNNPIGSSSTMTRQSFTLGQTDVPGEPTYFCRMVATSAANPANYVILQQRIEDVRIIANKFATVSFYAKADSNKPIAINLAQSFGSSGGGASVIENLPGQKFTLTTSWQKITATFFVPSLSGKTLGTDENSSLFLNIWLDAGSNWNTAANSLGQQSGTFDFAQVQVEEGPIATPFEQRPIGLELSLCQRYYEQSDFVEYYQFPSSSATQVQRQNKWWKVTKRTEPQVTVTREGGSPGTTVTTDGTSKNAVYFSFGGSQFTIITWSWTANAEL